MLHLLLGLLAPEAGSITLFGRHANQYTRREMSRMVGLVPQEEHVVFELSVLGYALLGRPLVLTYVTADSAALD